MFKSSLVSFLIVTFFVTWFVSCWDTSIDPFKELPDPTIAEIKKDEDENIMIILSFRYSDQSTIVLERKTIGGFNQINYKKLNQTTMLDTTIDKERDENYFYRIIVEQDGRRTNYSLERNFSYRSTALNAPGNLKARIIELQGVRLEWSDKSNLEDGYIVEKNDGSGYKEIQRPPINSTSHLDFISGSPIFPLQLLYRVKAYNSEKSSNWVEIETRYSGLAAPTNLRITDTTYNNFTIEWQDNSFIETGYVIERKKDNELFQPTAEVNANVTIYVDSLAELGTFTYRVRAIKDNLFSAYSNTVSHPIRSIPPHDLVAYYPFSGNAGDSSGNNYHGIPYGPVPVADRFGKPNSAYKFDGDDYIDLLNRDLISSENFAVSVWIYPTEVESIPQEFNTIINKWKTLTGWFLGMNSVVKIRITVGDGTFNPPLAQGGTIDLNRWTHLVAQRDGNILQIYQNSKKVAENINTSNMAKNSANLLIGVESDPTFDLGGFIGTIDDIRIYKRSLSEPEIQELCNKGGWNCN